MNRSHALLITQIALGFVAAAALFAVFHVPTKEFLRGLLLPPEREILSTVRGNLNFGTTEAPVTKTIRVIKVKTPEGLFIEVYVQVENEPRKLLDRIALENKTDAFFHLNGQATNLALEDLDGDKNVEIIAPTYDENLVARLNVFRFNTSTEKFEMFTP